VLALHLSSVMPYLDLNDTLANLIGDMFGGQDGEPMAREEDEEDNTACQLALVVWASLCYLSRDCYVNFL
jgi:hypothetical protein